MPFTCEERNPTRFEGDFELRPATGYDPNSAEIAYIAKLEAVLEDLHAGQSRVFSGDQAGAAAKIDAATHLFDDAIRSLRLEADELSTGRLSPEIATANALVIASGYKDLRAKLDKRPFTCEERNPKRFDGDFELRPVAGYGPITSETAYIVKLETVLEDLLADSSRGTSKDVSGAAARTAAAKHLFDEAIRSLRLEADEFCLDRLSPEIALDNVLVIKGRYKGLREKLDQRLFFVTTATNPDTSPDNLAKDILIYISPDLPGQENLPSPQKQELFNAMATTSSVMLAVHHRTVDSAKQKRWWHASNDQATAQKTAAANRLLDEFIRNLVGIGQVGLEGPHADLGKLALADLRKQYVSRVAAGIKNTYVRSLGWTCLLAAALLLIIYVCIKLQYGFLSTDFWQEKKNFFLLTAGSAVGTWLSFSIRRVTLTFEDLAVLEEDLLDPSLRVMFVVGLTSLVGLLFWTGAVNLEVGDMKTIVFKNSGSISLLTGAFCGIAERSLATAISGRAAALVKGVAGN